MTHTSITVIIPGYERPEILEVTLPNWLKAKHVGKISIVAEVPSQDTLKRYKKIIEKYGKNRKIVYKLNLGKLDPV